MSRYKGGRWRDTRAGTLCGMLLRLEDQQHCEIRIFEMRIVLLMAWTLSYYEKDLTIWNGLTNPEETEIPLRHKILFLRPWLGHLSLWTSGMCELVVSRAGRQELPCYRNGSNKIMTREQQCSKEASELWMECVGNEKSFLQKEEEIVIQNPHENEEGNQPLLLVLKFLLHWH